jgi:pilus assembly protein CpaC
MIKKIFVACLLSMMTALCFAAERIELYLGEIKVLKVGAIDRIAIGNPKVVSNSVFNDGQLLLIAEAEGSSEVHIWFIDGSESELMVHVTSQANNIVNRKKEVEKLLADINGLEVSVVGEKIVLTGIVAAGHEEAIQTVMDNFEEVMNNINFPINNLEKKKSEVEELLADIGGLTVRIVGEKIVLSGEVESGYETAIETVQGAIPEVMNLTRTGGLDLNSPDNKMVLMNIKITEFNKNYLQNLGIAWDTTVAGPAAAVALSGVRNPEFRATELPNTSFNAALTAASGASPLGYFGIAAEITSRINFAVNSGNALILAEPRLAARSGGEATFLAGGEFPIESSSINGTTVEFKQFGIQLEVKPTVDINDNVRANVSTELSSIDNSVAVNGVPGLLSRKTTADVILGSGETLVMSGLLNQEASKDITGVKFLMDIPIIGELFKSKTFRDKRSELVIFVTPQVFDANSDLNTKAVEYAKKGIEGVIKAIDQKNLDIIY